jgi:hypothetical protein
MNFFYLDKNIENTGLKKFSGQQKFSELTVQKLSLSNSIQKSLSKEFFFRPIESIHHISDTKQDIVVWNSNIFFKEWSLQELFIRKLQKLVKQNSLIINSKKHYKLTNDFTNTLKPLQKDVLIKLASFSAKIINLVILDKNKNY